MYTPLMMPAVFPVTCHTDFVGPGSIFVAIEGYADNGINYIQQAIEKGARTIVVRQNTVFDDALREFINERNVIVEYVVNTRKALALLSAREAGYPAQKLSIVGITGTKGKTTTSFLLEHIMWSTGYKTALISSAQNRICGYNFPAPLTTPQPDYLQQFLKLCVENNVDYVIMEIAAQALTLYRVEGIVLCGIIFTNFSHEHLEFYATLDDYFQAKCLIFAMAAENAPILVNEDNEWCARLFALYMHAIGYGFGQRIVCPLSDKLLFLKKSINTQKFFSRARLKPNLHFVLIGYPLEGTENGSKGLYSSARRNPSTRPSPRLRRAGGCLLLSNVEASGRAQRENYYRGIHLSDSVTGINFQITYQKTSIAIVRSKLFGEYNAYNVLAAVSMALELNENVSVMQHALQTFTGVPGRLQEHVLANGARCFIDYAHNPESFQAVLSTLRLLTDHLIVIFGAGGGRDRSKRPLMGEIAAQIADSVIITSDNPRLEDPSIIADDIIHGIPAHMRYKVMQDLDRKKAIEQACFLSDQGSIIALLGKGPDEYQIIGKTKYYFSERAILEKL